MSAILLLIDPTSEFVKGLACVLSLPWSTERATKCVRSVAANTPQAALEPILMAYRRLAAVRE